MLVRTTLLITRQIDSFSVSLASSRSRYQIFLYVCIKCHDFAHKLSYKQLFCMLVFKKTPTTNKKNWSTLSVTLSFLFERIQWVCLDSVKVSCCSAQMSSSAARLTSHQLFFILKLIFFIINVLLYATILHFIVSNKN